MRRANENACVLLKLFAETAAVSAEVLILIRFYEIELYTFYLPFSKRTKTDWKNTNNAAVARQ